MSIELCPLFRFPVRCGPGLLLRWIGELQALLSSALAGLNLRVVRGKSLAFKKPCLTRTERLALMIRGRFLLRAHADVSIIFTALRFRVYAAEPRSPRSCRSRPR